MNRWIKTKPSASKETCNPEAQYTCKFHHAQDTQPSAFRSDKPMVKLLHPLSVTSSCPGARPDPSDPPKTREESRVGDRGDAAAPSSRTSGFWEAESGTASPRRETTTAADPVSFVHFPGFQVSASDNCSPSSGANLSR